MRPGHVSASKIDMTKYELRKKVSHRGGGEIFTTAWGMRHALVFAECVGSKWGSMGVGGLEQRWSSIVSRIDILRHIETH